MRKRRLSLNESYDRDDCNEGDGSAATGVLYRCAAKLDLFVQIGGSLKVISVAYLLKSVRFVGVSVLVRNLVKVETPCEFRLVCLVCDTPS